MIYFTNQKTISAIKRMAYTGDKSSFSTVGTGTGYLRQLNEDEASVNNLQYGLAFVLIVETTLDIREGDRVTIDSIDYTIRGVATHDRGGITAFKRCVMTKPEKS